MPNADNPAQNEDDGGQNLGQLAEQLRRMAPLQDWASCPKFTGNPGEYFSIWRTQFEEICDFNALDEEGRLRALPMKLGGNAKIIFRAMSEEDKSTYENVMGVLENEFRPIGSSAQRARELYQRQQKPGEPVSQYALILRNLFEQAGLGNENLDAILTNLFINGTHKEIRDRLAEKDLHVLREAEHVAKIIENNQLQRFPAGEYAFFLGVGRSPTTAVPQNAEIAALTAAVRSLTLNQHTAPAKSFYSRQPMAQKFMPRFRDNSRPFNRSAVPVRASNFQQFRVPFSQNSRSFRAPFQKQQFNTNIRDDRKCFKCNRIGHIAQNCFATTTVFQKQAPQNQNFSRRPDTYANNARRPFQSSVMSACVPAITYPTENEMLRQENQQYKQQIHSLQQTLQIAQNSPLIENSHFPYINMLSIFPSENHYEASIIINPIDSIILTERNQIENAVEFASQTNHIQDNEMLFQIFEQSKNSAKIIEQPIIKHKIMQNKQTLNTTASCKRNNSLSNTISSSKYIIFIIMFFLGLTTSNPHTRPHPTPKFVSCENPKAGHFFHVPPKVQCQPPKYENIYRGEIKLWVPSHNIASIAAHKCYIRSRTICTNTGFFGSRGIVKDTSQQKSISVPECQVIAATNSWQHTPLNKINSKLWSSSKNIDIQFKWCCSTVCTTTENMFLQKGSIGTFDGEKLLSDLGDVGNCSPHRGWCAAPDSIIIWNGDNVTVPCDYTYKGKFSALISHAVIVVETLTGAFTPLRTAYNEIECLPNDVLLTEQGPAFQLIYYKDDENFTIVINHWQEYSRLLRTSLKNENFKYAPHPHPLMNNNSSNSKIHLLWHNDPNNVKFEYLALKTAEQIHDSFWTLWLTVCQLAQRQHDTNMQLLYFDATLGVRALFKNNSLIANWAGDALLVSYCEEFTADYIHYDYQVNGKCYKHLPIRIGHKIYFVIPGTRDIVQHAQQIPCHDKPIGIYYSTVNGWQSPSGNIHVTTVPLSLIWKQQWTIPVFSSPPLFHEEGDYFQDNILLIRNYMQQQSTAQSQINKLIEFTANYAVDPAVFRDTLIAMGDGVSAIAHGTTGFFQSILRGPFQLLLNIVITAAIILGGLFSAYYLIQYSRRKQLLNKFRKQFKKYSQNSAIEEKPSAPLPVLEAPPTYPGLLANPSTKAEPSGPTIVTVATIHPSTRPKYKSTVGSKPRTVCMITNNQHTGIFVTIAEQTALALVDTGASVSILSAAFWQLITKRNRMTLQPAKIDALTASGESAKVLGAITLPFKIGDTVGQHLFYVIESCPHLAIIGTDLLKRLSSGPISFDFHKNWLYLNSKPIPLVSAQPKIFKTISLIAFLAVTTIIPAFTQKMIMCSVNTPFDGQNIIFQPDQIKLATKTLIAPAVIATIRNNQFPISIANFTSDPITVYAKTSLGNIDYPATTETIQQNILAAVTSAPKKQQSYFTGEVSLDLLKQNSPNLTEQQLHQLQSVLQQNKSLYSTSQWDIGRTHLIEHTINTGDHPPIRQPPHRTPLAYRPEVEAQLKNMQENGIIKESSSPWASPIVVVPRKNTSDLRVCCDFRKINSISPRDEMPLPRIDDILSALGSAKYFTTIDLAQGYHQVPVAEADKPKTAFCTWNNLYEYNVLPFGLHNGPSSFTRLMQRVLKGLDWVFAYLDDILIASATFEEHLEHIQTVFDRLKAANLKIKFSKSYFAKSETKYLGFIISNKGLKADPEKLKAIQQYPVPTNIKQLRSFLGLASYYRRFIKNFSTIAQPLNNLLKKEEKFKWHNHQQTAFHTLIEQLTTAPILKFPDFSKPFVLHTDSSGVGLGVVLSQDHDGFLHPIAFASRTLNPHEQKYTVTEQEGLAIIWSLKLFKHYLLGRKIIVFTDHAALQYIFQNSNPTGRLARWVLDLQSYDLFVKFKPGKANQVADALSRIPTTEKQPIPIKQIQEAFQIPLSQTQINSTETLAAITTTEQSTKINHEKIFNEQTKDPICSAIIKFLNTLELPTDNAQAAYVFKIARYCLVNNNLLYYCSKSKIHKSEIQLYVPTTLRDLIITHHHDLFGGHLGIRKTIDRLRVLYFWPTISHDVYHFVQSCIICQKRKPSTPTIKAALVPVIPNDPPFSFLAVDFMGPLPLTIHGNKYILSFMDRTTRFLLCFPTSNQTAETVANFLIDRVICTFGSPFSLLSDNARTFTSEFLKEVCRICDIRKIQVTPYHPQSNFVERSNRTVSQVLSSFCNQQQNDWDEWLPKACFAYNTAPHDIAIFSPFQLLFGRDPHIPIDAAIYAAPPSIYIIDSMDYFTKLTTFLTNAWNFARDATVSAHTRQQRTYNKRMHEPALKVGQLVLLHCPAVPIGCTTKLAQPFDGPFQVMKICMPVIYIRRPNIDSAPTMPVHFNRLKLLHERPQPNATNITASQDYPASQEF